MYFLSLLCWCVITECLDKLWWGKLFPCCSLPVHTLLPLPAHVTIPKLKWFSKWSGFQQGPNFNGLLLFWCDQKTLTKKICCARGVLQQGGEELSLVFLSRCPAAMQKPQHPCLSYLTLNTALKYTSDFKHCWLYYAKVILVCFFGATAWTATFAWKRKVRKAGQVSILVALEKWSCVRSCEAFAVGAGTGCWESAEQQFHHVGSGCTERCSEMKARCVL